MTTSKLHNKLLISSLEQLIAAIFVVQVIKIVRQVIRVSRWHSRNTKVYHETRLDPPTMTLLPYSGTASTCPLEWSRIFQVLLATLVNAASFPRETLAVVRPAAVKLAAESVEIGVTAVSVSIEAGVLLEAFLSSEWAELSVATIEEVDASFGD